MGWTTLTRLGLRDLRASPGRTLLAIVAMALGTAVVLSALASREATADAVSVALTAAVGSADATANPLGSRTGLVDPEALATVRSLPGVRRVYGTLSTVAVLAGPGAPVGEVSVTAVDGAALPGLNAGDGLSAGEGLRSGQDDVILGPDVASSLRVAVGDTVRVTAPAGMNLTVVGVSRDEGSSVSGLRRSVSVSMATARALRNGTDGFSTLRIELDPATPVDDWVRINAPRMPPAVLLSSADEAVGELQSARSTVASGIDMLAATTVLLGCLLCYYVNQVAAVADRRRTALLLVVGATRRDLRILVLSRALATASVGAVAGCALGLGLARTMTPLVVRTLGYTSRSADPPAVAYAVAVVAAFVIALTSLAALPTRGIGPVDALRTADTTAERTRRSRLRPAGLIVAASLVVALFVRLPALLNVIVGIVLLLSTAWAMRELLVLSGASSRPSRTGRRPPRTRPARILGARALARDARSSGSAMGLLMAAFAVLLATATAHQALAATVDHALARQLPSDLQISFPRPDAPPSPAELRGIDGVTGETRLAFGLTTSRRDGVERPLPLTAIEPATYFGIADFDWRTGDPTAARLALQAGGATLLSEPIARQLQVRVGDDIEVRTVTGPGRLRVVGTFVSFLGSAAVIGRDDAHRLFALDEPRLSLLAITPGRQQAVQAELHRRWHDGDVTDVGDIRSFARVQLLALFGIGFATLLVAVGLGICGLAASLSASVLRRTEEFRLLRSIGASRRDVIRMVTWEAFAIVVAGMIVSIPMGLALSRVTLRVFEAGLGTDLPVVIPVGLLVAVPLAVLPVAVAAALVPAWRASRVSLTSA